MTLAAAFLLMTATHRACAQTQKSAKKATTTKVATQPAKKTTNAKPAAQPVKKTTTAKPAARQVKKTATASPATPKVFVLADGKLGPIKKGAAVSTFPKQVEGLYDKFETKTEEYYDNYDSEETCTTEYVDFTKAGKPVFRAGLDEGKVAFITLLEGSSNIKTPDGIYVGYNARELFKRKKMEWETYYEGDVFASDGTYSYSVSSDDLIDTDIPQEATDFKQNAKVTKITYLP